MAFDPAQFLRVAAILASEEANEAMLRTAIGRTYYALFLMARDRLGVVTTDKVHSEVIRLLRRRDKKVGDQMFSLLNLRLAADYQMTPEYDGNRNWRSNWIRARDAAAFLQPRIERM